GNVRELKNAVERSLYRWGDPSKPVDEIILDPFRSPFAEAVQGDAADETTASEAPEVAVTDATAAPMDFAAHIASIEKRLLREALTAHGYHQRRTAEALGLSYDQLRGLVRKYGLSPRGG
ncbi:MAG: phage shock protein operon transcriptional activator, partial [Halioglobus sp.]|nr:phage shock protein operon transcriptional activator [Halioglobus sp.]